MSDDENNMVTTSLWVAGTIGALKALVFVCDIITYPVYYMLHRPREKLNMSQRVKARQVESDDGSITIRSLQRPGKVHVTVVREGVDTLQRFLHFVVGIYGDKNCLGTRQILSEDDELQPSGRVFKKYTMGDYKWKSFRMLDEEAASFGRGLRILGQEPLMNVAIFAETRAEWMVAAHGCFKQNIPLVTLYATLGEEAIAHGLNETEASIVITTHNLLPNFKKILPLAPKVKILIYMEDQLKETDTSGFKEGVHIVSFSQVIKDGRPAPIAEVAPKAEDTAIIMYTSGSTGTPKGVILTHKNMITTMKAFSDAVDIFDDDVFMGFLPLAHVFELLTECVCLVYGVSIGYSTPLTMMDTSSKIKKGSSGDATVLKPTLLTSVPLILDRIRKGVNDKVSKSSGLQRELFRFAYEYRRAWARRGFNTPLVNKLVFGKTRQLLGGRIRLVLCGGAPLAQDTHEFIKVCLCVDLTPGYGLTETCSAATVLDRYDMSTGRVGNPTTVTDVRLVDWAEGNYTVKDKPYPRGEVIIGGEHVSPGYYKLPDRANEDFVRAEGRHWFKSGDIAELHPDGVLTIIDRKKDLVKLQLGEYVSLGKVEMELKTSPLVENVCVYGDSSKEYTVALVVPSAGPLAELAAAEGIPTLSFEQLCERPDVERAVLRELQDHARRSKLEKFEIPEAIKLCSEVWSPDMGLVTAAFKLRRKMIQDRYQHEINRMYAS
ncbi:long-chain-fatty-acid--CoA ligase 4 isoform X2 [Bacillus rossius redtenbacheri]|uniref:long-chain-fatty-acid--CoA ligase 4 isoform X2 n=1 Tax=Bacillus rossius redtenbacheri TaxID=93214 RepID=UPI002FDD5823